MTFMFIDGMFNWDRIRMELHILTKILNMDNEVQRRHGITPLHLAAATGQLDLANTLLTQGLDINQVLDINSDMYGGFTPLYFAIQENRLDVVNFLIAHGADVNHKANEGLTPLDFASVRGYLDIVDTLIANGADVNALDHKNFPALHFAAGKGYDHVVTVLLKHGADVSVKESDYEGTALHVAVYYGRPQVVKTLIVNGADVNAKMVNNFTPLHLGAQVGNLDVVKSLLMNGAFFDARSQIDRYDLPLHFAERSYNFQIIKLLKLTEQLFKSTRDNNQLEVENCLKEGAFVNSRSIRFETPLLYASWKGYINIINLLLKNGANVNFVNDNSVTPLHYAAKFNHLEVVHTLLKHGAMFDVASSKSNKKPLDFAQGTQNTNIADLLQLISRLFDEAKNGNYEIVKELVTIKDKNSNEFLAITNARNNQGQTLIQTAFVNKHKDIASSLIKVLEENEHHNVQELGTELDNITLRMGSSSLSSSSS